MQYNIYSNTHRIVHPIPIQIPIAPRSPVSLPIPWTTGLVYPRMLSQESVGFNAKYQDIVLL